jgi:tetratricopeptide (TPR) repeat protein
VVGLAINDWYVSTERDRANRSFDLARRSLNEMLDLIATDLGYVKGSEQIRQNMALKAENFYEQMVPLRSQDPQVLLDAANAFRRLGNVFRMTGQSDVANRYYRRSDELISALPAQDSLIEASAIALAERNLESGESHRLKGGTGLAVQENEHALALLSPFQNSNSKAYRVTAAKACLNLSAAHMENGELDSCRTYSERAIGLLESLGSRNLILEKYLIGARSNLAVSLRDLGEASPAIVQFEKALDQIRSLQATFEGKTPDPDLGFFIASTEQELGEARARSATPDSQARADDHFSLAVAELDRLVSSSPKVPVYGRELAVALNRRGAVRLSQGRVGEAQQDCSSAADRLEQLCRQIPNNPDFLSQLGQTCSNLSKIKEKEGKNADRVELLHRAAKHFAEAVRINPANKLDALTLQQVQAELTGTKP